MRFVAVALAWTLTVSFATSQDGDPGPTGAPEITPEAEKAIQKGLDRLARTQSANGSWSSSAPVATTSMCCLALMASGSTVSRGPYAGNVRRAIEYLLRRTARSGFIADGPGGGSSGMHGHGFATMLFAECLGTIDDGDLYAQVEDALKRAIRRIESTQNRYGGWNASPDANLTDDGSGAVAIMQIMALRSARSDGITIRHQVIEKAKKYVQEMTTADGWYQYNWGSRGGQRSCGLTGPGIYMLGALGEFDTPKYDAGIKNIMSRAPFISGNPKGGDQGWGSWYYYALFYCSLAIFQHGGEEWDRYYPAMRDDLVRRQAADGTWEDPYGGLYTAFALLSLELPYRQLPFFQEGGRGREGG